MEAKNPKTLSGQLRRIIAECGLSQYEISKRSGVDEASLSRFANGRRGLTTETLDRLAEVLGLDLITRQKPKRKGTKKGG